MTNNHNNNNKNIKTYIMYINIIPHISVWGSSFLAATPLAAAIRRRRGYLSHAPSSSQSILSTSTSLSHASPHQSSCSHVHSTTLTHIQLHIILFTSPTHIISTDHHPHPLHLSHSYHLNRSPSTPTPAASPSVCIFTYSSALRCVLSGTCKAQYPEHSPEPPEGAAARVVAAGAAGCPRCGRLPLAALRVGGALSRGSGRGCGARCRGWCRWLRVAGAVSRASRRGYGARCRRWCRCVVAAGATGCPRYGRRTLHRLRKGLRRALSPLVPLAARWLPSHSPEPPEGAVARVVAAGAAGCPPRGRRSTQSLQKGLRRALSPLVPLAALRVAGAVPRALRRGCGARCRRWCRLSPTHHHPLHIYISPPSHTYSSTSSSSPLPLTSSQQITIHTNTISFSKRVHLHILLMQMSIFTYSSCK